MSNSEIKQIEDAIAQNKRDIALLDALESLRQNKHFIEVISKGFCTDKAVQLVRLKANPDKQNLKDQDAILKEIDGIGTLQQYFDDIVKKGEIAKTSLHGNRETLEAVLTELNKL